MSRSILPALVQHEQSSLGYAIGIAARFGVHYDPSSLGVYITMFLFITLSPCGFIAAEYVLMGRMAQWLQASQHLLLRPQRVTLVFVLSDVLTFLIQVSTFLNFINTPLRSLCQSFGGSLEASALNKPNVIELGTHVRLLVASM